MRKHIALIGLFACLTVVCVSFSAPGKNHYKADLTFKPVTYHFNYNFIALNAAVTPSVLPVYGKCVYVNPLDSHKGFAVKDITPNANSPPVTNNRG